MISTNQKNVVSKLANAKKINYTPLLLMGNFGLSLVIILQLLFQGSLLLEVGNEPPTRFVELANGQTLKTQPITSSERSPEVIDKFTRTMMEALFSASYNITVVEGNNLEKAAAVSINEKTITERSAVALMFVTPELMPMLLDDISSLVDKEILSGGKTRVLKITHLSKPEKVENKTGYWELQMVANLYSYNPSDRQLLASRFNKKIRVKVVDYPTDTFQSLSLDLNQKILNVESKKHLKELFFNLSNVGLEISLISSL
ncbi:MAG: hypothetical protein QNJ70_20125 [Xenococcaceae cyanobacterium MO_207.B15]|nr:hypothetical protein [Xenococcaceae cyanobacterium MO_207.B15]